MRGPHNPLHLLENDMEKAKVLLPVDGMRNSVPAEDYAVELNKRMALEVTVLNVFNTRQVEGRGLNIRLQEMVRESHETYMSKILEEVMDKFKKGGVEAKQRLMSGDPGTVICNLAVDEKFDFVIISDSGLAEFRDWLAGSVTNHVLYRCLKPVILVKHTHTK